MTKSLNIKFVQEIKNAAFYNYCKQLYYKINVININDTSMGYFGCYKRSKTT